MAAAAGGGKRIAIDVTKLMMSDAFDVQLNGDLMTDLHVLFQGPKDSASPAAALLQRSALRSAARSRRTTSSRVRRPVRGRRLASARAATGGLSLQGGRPAVFRRR